MKFHREEPAMMRKQCQLLTTCPQSGLVSLTNPMSSRNPLLGRISHLLEKS